MGATEDRGAFYFIKTSSSLILNVTELLCLTSSEIHDEGSQSFTSVDKQVSL
jgi:hypothetical protein